MLAQNLEETKEPEDAQIHIFRVCSVTDIAQKEAEAAIRRSLAFESEPAVVAAGCITSSMHNTLSGTGAVLFGVEKEDSGVIEYLDVAGEQIVFGGYKSRMAESMEGHTRAFLKVQEGCSNYCSYCIVPFLRGKERSVPPVEALVSFKNLISRGYKEVVLCGTHLGEYGRDIGSNLFDLLKLLEENSALSVRLRLSSLEPQDLFNMDVKALLSIKNVCPHLHIPMQSGSDKILTAMNRRYSVSQYKELTRALRKINPLISISTDLICGFPGETLDDLEETIQAVKDIKFMRTHVFPFSPREGTKAFFMNGFVGAAEAKERCETVKKAAKETAEAIYTSQTGEVQTLLTEKRNQHYSSGYTEYYFPVRVQPVVQGEFYRVKITGAAPGFLKAQVLF